MRGPVAHPDCLLHCSITWSTPLSSLDAVSLFSGAPQASSTHTVSDIQTLLCCRRPEKVNIFLLRFQTGFHRAISPCVVLGSEWPPACRLCMAPGLAVIGKGDKSVNNKKTAGCIWTSFSYLLETVCNTHLVLISFSLVTFYVSTFSPELVVP